MDIRKIKQLMALLENSDVSELEVHEGENSVRLSRKQEPSRPAAYYPASAGPITHELAPIQHINSEVIDPQPVRDEHIITAPMVGTFYTASAPSAEPFVSSGQSIQMGDTLCIIEAMKMLNQIESEVTATVLKVLVANGEPVEFGQALFVVRLNHAG